MDTWSELRQAERESERDNALPIPRSKQKESKVKLSREPRSWHEEQLEHFYRKIVWDNKTILQDRRAFFAKAYDVLNKKGESTLIGALRYCEEKGKLYPKYVIKVLIEKLK